MDNDIRLLQIQSQSIYTAHAEISQPATSLNVLQHHAKQCLKETFQTLERPMFYVT